MENYTITKSNVECYKIRHSKYFYWADITIDASIGNGRIQIASDFGDYQHYWGACGDSFKEFLCNIHIDYAASKFGEAGWFDSDLTIKSFKKTVLEERKTGRIDAELARKIFDEVNQLDDYCAEIEFYGALNSLDNLMAFYNWSPPLERTISPKFRKFWREIWPVFTQTIKNES